MKKRATGKENPWLTGLLTILITLLVFLPSLGNGFVNWDDLTMIDEPGWMGLGPQKVHWWFTSFLLNDYKPMVWLSYAMDYTFWGLNPAGYHLSNILLHALNAFLLFFLLLKIDRGARVHAAVVAALFFSLHPLRVESVSWFAERKDVLFGFFYLLSVMFYIGFVCDRGPEFSRERRRLNYLSSLLCAVFACLAKPMAVSLPAVLILIDFFFLRRLETRPGKAIVEKIPYIFFALVISVVTITSQLKKRSLLFPFDVSIKQRLLLAGKSWLFYLVKTVYPVGLHAVYPKDPHFLVPAGLSVLAGAGILIVTACFFNLRRKGTSWPLFSWLIYLLTLLPVSGLIPAGQVWIADRFTYLPAMGVSFALYFALGYARGKARNPVGLLCGGVLLVISILTIEQELVWKDSVTLWRRSLAIDPDSLFAHNNLGTALSRRGRTGEALFHFYRAIRINPEYAEAHNNLGAVLESKGKDEEAFSHYSEALRLKPDFEEAHYNLANLFLKQGRFDEAVAHYKKAVEIKPALAEAHYNLGSILLRQGKLDEASDHFGKAIEIKPVLREKLGIAQSGR